MGSSRENKFRNRQKVSIGSADGGQVSHGGGKLQRTVQGVVEIAPEEEAKLWEYGRLFGRAERTLHAALERRDPSLMALMGKGKGQHGGLNAMATWVAARFGMKSKQAESVVNRVQGIRSSVEEGRSGHLAEFAGSANGKKKGLINLHGERITKKLKSIEKARSSAKDLRKNAVRQRKDGEELVGRAYMERAYKQDDLARRGSFALKGLYRRAARLERRFERLRSDQEAKRIPLCFGGKKLFDQRNRVGDPSCPFRNHQEWKAAWLAARDGGVFLVGDKWEKHGNPDVRVEVVDGVGFSVTIALPFGLRERWGKVLAFQVPWNEQLAPWWDGLVSASSQKPAASIERGEIGRRALTYRLTYRHDKKRWYIGITSDEPSTKKVSSALKGAIGLDLNATNLAMTRVDASGNFQERRTFRISGHKALAGTTRREMGAALREVMNIARDKGIPVVIENLDFSVKKRLLRLEPSKRARMLSAFAYKLYMDFAESRADKDGVELIKINPAYTSTKGMILFARRLGLSSGEAAAMTIARQGMNCSWDATPPRWVQDTGQRTSGMRRTKRNSGTTWEAVHKKLKAQGLLRRRHELCCCQGKLEAALRGDPPTRKPVSRKRDGQTGGRGRRKPLPDAVPTASLEFQTQLEPWHVRSHSVEGVASQPGLFDLVCDP
jgi:IS605 OrfB family transposase